MDDLLTEFIVESTENIAQLDEDLVDLEKHPDNPQLLQNIFRALHTIKGTCGFIGMPRLEKVAHAGENVLGAMRDGNISVAPDIISLILECIDAVKMILTGLAENATEPEGDDQDLIQRLNALLSDNKPRDTAQSSSSKAPPLSEEEAMAAMQAEFDKEITASEPSEPADPFEPLEPAGAIKETKKSEAVVPKGAAPQTSESKTTEHAAKEALVTNQSIRVNVSLLEELMTMVSELVLTRNQLMQMIREKENNEFAVPLQRLNYVTSELQETVMKTRMQPVSTAWTKLPRLIRDLANDLNKKIDLELIGSETELDRQVVEFIKDPLMHMIRNSADHGLETPQERLAAGKSEVGKVTLNAYHAGGHIHIELTDDGRGLSLQKIKEKAIANGFIKPETADTISESQIYQFIFKAGLSTAEKVTNVSGRGVGMDVVKTNIEKIGGTIDVKSTQNKGTKFTIKIPLTLTIVSSLITEVRGHRFAIPQLSVLELVKISQTSQYKIEYIKSNPVLRLRNKLLPLIFLKKLLKLETDQEYEKAACENENCYIIILQVGEDVFGVIVDQVYDTQEIVVKPVCSLMQDISIFGGNTILGDGSVIMILDPNGIAAVLLQSDVLEHVRNDFAAEKAKKKNESKDILLICQDSDDSYKAVPLSLVTRLEKFNVSDIETSDNHYRIKYSNTLMPLIPISDGFDISAHSSVPVLVFTRDNQSLGVIVSKIINTVEENIELKIKSDLPGILGSTIINNISTDIIDTEYYIEKAHHYWNKVPVKSEEINRIIYVGNNEFYTSFLKPSLMAEGYNPTFVDSAEQMEEAILAHRDSFLIALVEEGTPSAHEFTALLDTQKYNRVQVLNLVAEHDPLIAKNESGFSHLYKYNRDQIMHKLNEMLSMMSNLPNQGAQLTPGAAL